MQHFLTVSQIENRAEAIRLKPRGLCAAAKVSESTWSRWKDGDQQPLASKITDVAEALVGIEIGLLEHLLTFHADRAVQLLIAAGVLPASCGAPSPPSGAAGSGGEGRIAPDLPAEAARGAA